MKLVVAYSTDENYAKHAWVSLLSLLETNIDFDEIEIYLIENSLSESTKILFENLSYDFNRKIIFVPFEEITIGLVNARPWANSLSAYGRLFLGRLNDINKILYLDCDSIICGSLKELWNTDIKDYYFAGVQDTAGPKLRAGVGLAFNERYINSGVALINLKKWRENNLEEEFIKFIDKYDGNVPCADQGTLNGVCKGEILILEPKYNVMTPMFSFTAEKAKKFFEIGPYYSQKEIDEAVNNSVIIHYVGGFFIRPWYENSNHPKKGLYLNYLAQSPWKGEIEPSTNLGRRTETMKMFFKLLPFPVVVLTHRIARKVKKIISNT
jgi:lipopolysaccharide biosynthesis glycosyltransferase